MDRSKAAGNIGYGFLTLFPITITLPYLSLTAHTISLHTAFLATVTSVGCKATALYFVVHYSLYEMNLELSFKIRNSEFVRVLIFCDPLTLLFLPEIGNKLTMQ